MTVANLICEGGQRWQSAERVARNSR